MATLNTVTKVGLVLDLFSTRSPEWGVSEVASRLDIPRSSAHAVLSSLADIGVLQWREGGRYRVGWRVLELAEVQRGTIDVRAAAEPVLAALAAKHGETCHLAVRDRNAVLYLDKVLGTHNITVQGARVGTRLECHCTAVGKVLLAYADDAVVDEYLTTTQLRRHTTSTITTPEGLRADLRAIRRRGQGFDLGEAVEDVRCVAAPVRDDFGQVVAAVSMSAPVTRFEKNREQYAASVKASSDEISRSLVDSSARLGGDLDLDYPKTVRLQ